MNCEIKDFTNFPAHAGQNLRWSIRKDGCIAVMFTTGRSGQGRFRGLIDPVAQVAPGFTNISRNPGDFDYHNYDAMNGCASSSGGESFADVSFDVKDPTGSAVRNPKADCFLAPGQKYYINFRNEKLWTDRNGQSKRGQPSCPAAKCGGVFQVQVNSWNDGRSPGVDPKNPGDRPGPAPCQPPPPMTAEEKFQWCISQPEKRQVYGANVEVYCRTQLPYISEYSKYPGLDVRGCPLTDSSLPCGGFSPCTP
ncbi:MAG: hypothetical protein PHS14_13820 [Elusimicrobia bacterium]|nr:hypothetical protein [Elusimicrobiota bacterium]